MIGEEGTLIEGTSGYLWALDPIDGTANFVLGLPHWCISVGCLHEGRSVVGAILDPSSGELSSGAEGLGSFLDGKPISCSSRSLDVSTWAIGLSETIERSRRFDWEQRLRPRIGRVRAMGSLCLDLVWAAAGRVDAFLYECGVAPWDFAAAGVIAREAGLRVIHVPANGELNAAIVAFPEAWGSALDTDLQTLALL